MEDNIVKFDKDTPAIAVANKVQSVLAVNRDTGEAGAVEFDLIVQEAGKNVAEAVKVTGNVLPTLGTANKRYSFTTDSAGRTLTWNKVDSSSGAPLVYAGNKQCSAFWDGTAKTWSKEDEVDLPIQDLVKSNLNKGSELPFVNQPSIKPAALVKFNKAVLDVVVEENSHSDRYQYSITLITRNAGTVNNWGNAIAFRQLDRENNLNQSASVSYKSTDTSLSAQVLAQLAKISMGGIQTLSFTIAGFVGRVIHVTIDTDVLVDADVLDVSYSDVSNKMYFEGGCYRIVPAIPSVSGLATKSELTNSVTPLEVWVNEADSFNVNYNKSFPLSGYPTDATQQSKVSILKKTILSVKIVSPVYKDWDYYISGFYNNHSVNGYGLIITRRRKSDGVTGNFIITSSGTGAGNIDSIGVLTLQKWALGGRQYTIVNPTNTVFGIIRIELAINLVDMPQGYVNLGYLEPTHWPLMAFDTSVYSDPIVLPTAIEQIKEFPTFKEALQAKQKGIIKVGSLLAESIVDSLTFSGSTTSYYPSQIWEQYKCLNKNISEPKSLSEIMTIKTETGLDATIKSFGKRFIYFGTTSIVYRTQDELKNKVNTHLNTSYEKLILPDPMPDAHRTTINSIMGVYELDNGELLIEVRNGIKENEADDYRGNRTQVYLTTGLKNLVPTINSNNIPEYDLTGIVSKVHEYKAWTQTQGKTGTTVSVVGNKIALSPYYVGIVGLVHYSNDYGKTWKVIFNMGVDDAVFSVPYKGSIGAWPVPSSLNPPMPADMWTAGGNSNRHVHGVTIDPYMNARIWVSTGDSGTNYQGRTALWYSDDEGVTWTRIQTKGVGMLDSYEGLQPMGVVSTKDYILVGSDSSTDGLYRWSRTKKSVVPTLEPGWWYGNAYNTSLKVIFGGSVVTREGYVYSVFHPNTPSHYYKGVVVFTGDGVEFKDSYYDEVSDGTSTGTRNIDWGSWIGQDRYGNIYVANANNKIIKLF